ncbi:protein CANDIDATE G-PROTEIN COUPLED RECEPTOR 7 [Lactuca sativa]|uniref:protein CANDIDATE G-PROTEIN COUPLED RECEPTOR 7 n=1 Tax=Lactuca sativa TaxID=4236 RepID=UPI000CD86312|nr:protein CANDIDATE G-PROTEIN COUPLED RECEPTOR 7 [Lactuca sativa]
MIILEKILTSVVVFFLLTAPSTADIISLNLYSDNRHMIFFSDFEFSHAGYVSFDISSLTVNSSTSFDPTHSGFVLQRREVQDQQNTSICPLDFKLNSAVFTFQDLSHAFNKSYPVTHPGMNSLFFVNCNGEGESFVTTEGRAELYNMDDGFWIKNKRCFHGIHLLMGGLLLMNYVQLICAAADLYFVKVTGTPHGFDGLFYIFQLIRTVLLFTVITLIGTGWCLWKPYLEECEIVILMFVIIVQVWANVDSILIWKFDGPYNIYRERWTYSSTSLDIICCFVIFVPIVLSVISLKKNREADANAAMNLVRLCLFGIVVFLYVLFTRFLVRGLFPAWMNYGVQEISILVVCVVMFFIFRPLDHEDDDKKAVQISPSSYFSVRVSSSFS